MAYKKAEQMKCSYFEKHFMEYLNGTLTLDEKKAFERHLHSCSRCVKEKKDWDNLMERIYEQEVPDPGQSYWASFNRRVFSKIDQEEHEKCSILHILIRRWVFAVSAVALVAMITFFSSLFWISNDSPLKRQERKVLDVIQKVSPESVKGIAEEMAPFYLEEDSYFQSLDDFYVNEREDIHVSPIIEDAIIPYSLLDDLDESETILLMKQIKLEMG